MSQEICVKCDNSHKEILNNKPCLESQVRLIEFLHHQVTRTEIRSSDSLFLSQITSVTGNLEFQAGELQLSSMLESAVSADKS